MYNSIREKQNTAIIIVAIIIQVKLLHVYDPLFQLWDCEHSYSSSKQEHRDPVLGINNGWSRSPVPQVLHLHCKERNWDLFLPLPVLWFFVVIVFSWFLICFYWLCFQTKFYNVLSLQWFLTSLTAWIYYTYGSFDEPTLTLYCPFYFLTCSANLLDLHFFNQTLPVSACVPYHPLTFLCCILFLHFSNSLLSS